jgi:molybdenum cofactor cytidylyltransferase
VRSSVDLEGVEVVVNDVFGTGCSSSIAASLPVLTGDVLVLMLGDQPGVTSAAVRALLAGRGDAPLAVCRYDDGRGHPFAFSRAVFPELADLHGDKGVWKLLDRGEVVEVPVEGPIPLDVDTWDDYRALTSPPGSRR